MSRVWSRAAAVLFMTGLAAMTGCKPKEGGKCSEAGSLKKFDATTVLSCVNGVYVKLPCRGPKGASLASSPECDDSIAADGDRCLPENNDSAACSVDRKSMLVCNAGPSGATFATTTQCRGPKQCAVTGNKVTCDRTLQSVGDPCDEPGIGTCSEDQKRRLLCKDKTWQVDRYCRGQRGCYTTGKELECDESIAQPDDPCGLSGSACSPDGKTELSCVGGHFIKHKDCKNWCSILANHTLDCE